MGVRGFPLTSALSRSSRGDSHSVVQWEYVYHLRIQRLVETHIYFHAINKFIQFMNGIG